MTDPTAFEPAGIAILSPTLTSRDTFASTRSSTLAVSLDSRVSVCSPITEFAETTSSSNVFCGGSGARGASWMASARVVPAFASDALLDVAGVCDVLDCALDDPALEGQLLVSGGGSWRAVVVRSRCGAAAGVLGRAGAVCSLRRVVFDRTGGAGDATGAGAGALDGLTSPTRASVSCTGLLAAAEGAAKSAGCDCAAAGAGTAFWRAAK